MNPPLMAKSTVMQLDGITKSYINGGKKNRVLHHVGFRVRVNEITTIVGPSGSGKTTLLRVIGGLAKPDSGTVRMTDAKDLYAMSDRKLSRYRNTTIGFIFQDYRLLAQYNAIENVMLPLMIAGLGKREQRRRADKALQLVGLHQYRKRRVDQLSGGQEQRVSIARALAMRPSVLIADEPTGNLDSARGAEIMELFTDLKGQPGISIVMVTHDDQLARQADHLIRIVDGRVQKDTYATE
ncbi:MAG: ABC transporter ATP-binding protein [Propionibacteriaceae bacterium]